MFIGHFAVGFAAKRAAPRLSLGTLFLASQFIDLIWPILLLIGWESVRIHPGDTAVTPLEFTHYPFTHGLISVLGWAVLYAGIYWLVKRRVYEALFLAGCVVSHWILDFVTHRPDLPLAPGLGTKVGLGLWNSVTGTVIVEGGIFIVGVALYSLGTRARDHIGTWSLWGLAALLALIYITNLTSPPPPNATAIGYVGLAQWLLIAAGYWIDRHRTVRV